MTITVQILALKPLQLMCCLHFICYFSIFFFSIYSSLCLRMYINRNVLTNNLSSQPSYDIVHSFLFSTTINKVENNAKYFYHYQRYTLTQEYFEKSIIPVPPLILIWYVCMIAQYIWSRLIQRCKKENKIEEDKYHLPKIFSEFKSVIIKYN
jgi:hypothetical protein